MENSFQQNPEDKASRKYFPFNLERNGTFYKEKKLEVYYVTENEQ
jgi:hypothetical protein